MSSESTGILLDTHVWVWLVNGVELKPEIIEVIEKQASQKQIYLSSISLWEVAMLHAKQCLELSTACRAWFQKAIISINANLIDINPEIAINSVQLTHFHGDPADRLITATNQYLNTTLLTRDRKIIEYARDKAFKVLGC